MTIFFILMIVLSNSVNADLYMIAHKSFPADKITTTQLQSIYLGDMPFLHGMRIIPLDQDMNSVNRMDYYDSVVAMPTAQVISHWSKLIFTGKGQAPMSLSDDKSILEFVKDNPNAIGYINSKSISNDVKIVNTIKLTN